MRDGAEHSDRATWRISVVGLVLAFIMQCVTFAYFYGRLAERVDSVQRNTERLLQLQLDKQAKGY